MCMDFSYCIDRKVWAVEDPDNTAASSDHKDFAQEASYNFAAGCNLALGYSPDCSLGYTNLMTEELSQKKTLP